MKALKSLALVVLLSSGVANSAWAQSTWTGGSGNWNTGSNWSGGVVPPANSALIFDGNIGSTTTIADNFPTNNTAYGTITFTNTSGSYVINASGTTNQLRPGNITDNSSATDTINLKLSFTTTRSVTVASGGTLVLGGIISGTGTVGLSAGGAGTLVLSANNSYTGNTTVTGGGTLVLSGPSTAAGVGALSLAAGTTLAGTGGSAGSSFSVGTSSGTSTVLVGKTSAADTNTTGILKLSGTTTSSFTKANLTYNLDTLTTNSNTLALGATPSVLFSNSTLTFNLQNAGVIPAGTQYTLFTSTVTSGSGIGGSVFGGDLTLSGSNVISGLTLTFDISGSPTTFYNSSYLSLVNLGGSGYDIVLTVVPEPSTWVLMLGGLTLLLAVQRTRRSRNS